MIHFFIGTKAQFIKIAPIMVELDNRSISYKYVDSGQHAELTKILRKTFGIRDPDIYLHEGSDISSIFAAVRWTLKLIFMTLFAKNKIRQKIFPQGGICLVHGDTLSTLLGLKIAKAAGLKVAHVEAGLRSFNIFHPFPEELIRIYCMKRCKILFAPSDEAVSNLKAMHVKGRIVRISGNTVVDSLRLMEKKEAGIEVPQEEFALAACHRLETITKKGRLRKIIELLNRISQSYKVVFVTHKPTRKYIEKFGLMELLDSKILVLDMQDYVDFVTLIREAKLVLADGGSIQEECAYLGKPCLVLRNRTERPDGIGKNAMLWEFKDSKVNEFMQTVDQQKRADQKTWPEPSVEIVEVLMQGNMT